MRASEPSPRSASPAGRAAEGRVPGIEANDEILAPTSEEGLRKEALASIRRKRAFKQTAITYVLVNLLLVVIWAFSGAGFFWPAFVIGGWGIGLAFQGWDAYRRRRHVTEDQVAREMDRLRGG